MHIPADFGWQSVLSVLSIVLGTAVIPRCNLFCYGQVESPYGSGDYLHTLLDAFGDEHETLIVSEIEDKSAIYDSIKTFLGRGK